MFRDVERVSQFGLGNETSILPSKESLYTEGTNHIEFLCTIVE